MEYQGKGSDTRHALALNSAMDKHSSEQNARLRKAYDLKKQGYSDDYIWTQTGTRLIGNEDALLYVDDLKFKNNVDITKLPEGTYKASEILDGDLLKNFKEIGNLDVEITNLKDVMSKITNNKSALDSMDSVGGSASLDEGIKLNSKYINDNKNNPKLKQMIEELLSHEVQHIIQDVEYPNSGETLYFGIDKNTDEIFYFGDTQENAQKAYRNHPKEIEAEVTNLQNAMTKEQRHKFPLDLLFDEVKNHYKNNIVDIKTTQFINELEKKYGKDLEKWYTNSRNGVEKDAFKRYTYGNQRNIEDQKALSNSKKNAVVDVSYGDGRKTTGYLEDFKRKSKLHDGTSDRAYKELDDSSFFNEETRYSLSDY